MKNERLVACSTESQSMGHRRIINERKQLDAYQKWKKIIFKIFSLKVANRMKGFRQALLREHSHYVDSFVK